MAVILVFVVAAGSVEGSGIDDEEAGGVIGCVWVEAGV